jgi:hypothetical protein
MVSVRLSLILTRPNKQPSPRTPARTQRAASCLSMARICGNRELAPRKHLALALSKSSQEIGRKMESAPRASSPVRVVATKLCIPSLWVLVRRWTDYPHGTGGFLLTVAVTFNILKAGVIRRMNRQAAGESFVTVSHSITTLMNNSDFYPSGIHFIIKEKRGKKRMCPSGRIRWIHGKFYCAVAVTG